MLCDFVDPRSALWRSCLQEVRHDVYHLPEYVQLCSGLYAGGMPRAFIARDETGLFVVPLILRPIENWVSDTGLYDAIGPYGYASPIVAFRSRRPADWNSQHRFLQCAIECLMQCLQKEHVVSVFCRLHPMLAFPLQPLQHFGTVVEHGPTVYCDLSCSTEELWHQTRGTVRRRIKRVTAAGFVAEEDCNWSSLTDFEEAYRDTMHRVGAADWYFFDHDHFIGLRDNLHANMHLLVVRFGERMACAGLLSETCGIVQFHLAGTRSGFEDSDAIKLLTHFARDWGKARGNDVFHLGGGVGAANDSLFYFKSGFSKHRSVFQTWRLIIDPQTYSDLVVERRMSDEITPEGRIRYFPEYRTEFVGRCSPLH